MSFKNFLAESKMTREEALSILGLTSAFTTDELKAAYRRASMKNHPDRGGSVDAMQRVNVANDLLSKLGSTTDNAQSFRDEWEARNAKYKAAHVVVLETFKQNLDVDAFSAYFQKLVGRPLHSTVTFSSPDGVGGANYANVRVEFVTDDKEVKFEASFTVQLLNVVHKGGSLGASDSSYFDIGVTTEYFANNRKQKITQSNYNTKSDLKILSDPKIIFPEAKIKKGLNNKTTKFTKKDMFLALETKLGAKVNGDDVFIPIKDDLFLSVYRITFMREPLWMIRGVWKKTKYSFTNVAMADVNSLPESEDTIVKFSEMVKAASAANDAEAMVKVINAK